MSFYRNFKSHNGLPITLKDKEWVENSFAWFAENFGLDRVEDEPVFRDTDVVDDRLDYRKRANFMKLYEFICGVYKLDPEEIDLRWFDQEDSKKWVRLSEDSRGAGVLGLFLDQHFNVDRHRKFRVLLHNGLDRDPFYLAGVLAHELAHVALLGKKYLTGTERYDEQLTDLFCIYSGFGAFLSNSSAYLPPEIVAYANALLVKISGKQYDDYLSHFTSSTSAEFKIFSEYLYYSDDFIFSPEFMEEIRNFYSITQNIRQAYDEGNGDALIQHGTSLLDIQSHTGYAFGVIADGHLENKNYPQALSCFEEGMTYLEENESYMAGIGYCQMQMDDMVNAFTNIEMALVLNPFNSWVLRVMGEFLVKAGKPELALEHFEKAYANDRDTEEIHFWLGQTHLLLGNLPLAKMEFARSKALKEMEESEYPVIMENEDVIAK